MIKLSKKQEDVFKQIADNNKVDGEIVKKIFHHQFKFTYDNLSDLERTENGSYKEESFKTILLPKFGKFSPNLKAIRKINNIVENNGKRKLLEQ